MTHSTECPECGGSMYEGFVCDESYSTVKPSEWVEGRPQSSIWTGTRLRGKARYPIASFRCIQCGYVKLYAHPSEDSDAGRSEIAERLERLEDELARLTEREQFLLELLRGRAEKQSNELAGGAIDQAGLKGGSPEG